ncbi:MAG: DEAD/DEAH box helicase [Bacteroidales bacterium]|nr:DEAD/DEAH box helicase [Bacteroidales bacterium]
MKFSDFRFDTMLQDAIDSMGYDTPTPIQEQAIPIILEGKDLIASAQTGTGKTAAFLLPLIQKLMNTPVDNLVKVLVIVPTRELALQIDQQMEGFSYGTTVSSIAVYGGNDGVSFSREKTALTTGAGVVVCTPGRMIAHINMGYVDFSGLQTLVLDEADRMLDMGFFDDIMKILNRLPQCQRLMFSATMPPKIKELARKIMNHPEEISLAVSKPAERVLQVAYVVYENQKIPFLRKLLSHQSLKSVIVFCSTKIKAKELSADLKRNKLPVDVIHSDLDQQAREDVLRSFTNGSLNILVATDIISRGIDVDNIDLIVNFDVPNDSEDYVHRIGRTARADAEGVAVTLISEKEQSKFLRIEEFLGQEVYKDHLSAEFGETPEYQPKKRMPGSHRNFSSGKRPQRKSHGSQR